MTRQMPGCPSHLNVLGSATGMYSEEESRPLKPRWYFTKEEIEKFTPSRKAGISYEVESKLRHLYCSYLQEIGMTLKVPQVTIATAMMMCHRFYMYQSHSKNHWQTVATSSMFLACKSEDTPRLLKDIIVTAYNIANSNDPSASEKIKQQKTFENQKQLILLGETLVLATIAFDFNIEHPYKPMVAALKKLDICEKEVVRVAWNYVNDWLRSTLCLQYKPHYIAAGSAYLAAKVNDIKMPSLNGRPWWMQFDVSPTQLEAVIQHMCQLIGMTSSTQKVPGRLKTEAKPSSVKRKHDRTESSKSSNSIANKALNMPTLVKCNHITDNCKTSDSGGSAKSVVEDCVVEPVVPPSVTPTGQVADVAQMKDNLSKSDPPGSAESVVHDGAGELVPSSDCKIVLVKENGFRKLDVNRIREKLKKRKLDKAVEIKKKLDDELEDEIERELERGIESHR